MKNDSTEDQIKSIIQSYKQGKDVNDQLIAVRTGSFYENFHEWVLASVMCDKFTFVISISDIPIPQEYQSWDSFQDYMDEEVLEISGDQEKIAYLGISSDVIDIESLASLHFENMDGVCISVEATLEGKSGPRFYDLRLHENEEALYHAYKSEGVLLCGMSASQNSLNYSDEELVEIWDNFVKTIRQSKEENN